MAERKPVIGITCNTLRDDSFAYDRGLATKEQDFHLLAEDYIRSVYLAGGIPLLIPIVNDDALVAHIVENIDGLLLSGGCDVNPQRYGERISKCGILDPDRDTMEIALAQEILRVDKPLFAICRGCQILNVALGGTLYQDIPSEGHFDNHFILASPYQMPVHDVVVKQNTLLGSIIQSELLGVNSYHHSAVKNLATELEVNGTSTDGIIESYSFPDKKFVLAVQWHPEMMHNSEINQRLFRALIDACY